MDDLYSNTLLRDCQQVVPSLLKYINDFESLHSLIHSHPHLADAVIENARSELAGSCGVVFSGPREGITYLDDPFLSFSISGARKVGIKTSDMKYVCHHSAHPHGYSV